MKRLYHYPAILMASLIIAISSCSESDTYINTIPQNAGPVASINLTSLGDKAGLGDPDNNDAIKKLTDMLKNEMRAASFEKMEAIIDNPKKAGIDLKKPVYIFDNDRFFVAAIAKVLDKEDLSNTIKMLETEGNVKSITEEEGYSLALVNSKTFAAFNDNTLLLAQYRKPSDIENIKLEATALLNQKKEESLASDNGFIKMKEKKGDISLYISVKDIDKRYTHYFNEAMGIEDAADKSKFIYGINFEKGKIDVKAELYTEDRELKKSIDEKCSHLRPVDNSLLKFFPKSTLGIFSMGMDADKVYEMIMQNEDFRKNFSVDEAEKFGIIMNGLGDEISVGLVDFSLTQSPSIMLVAKAKDGKSLKEIYNLTQKDKENMPVQTQGNKSTRRFKSSGLEMIELKENEYVIKERGRNIFIAYKDNHIFVTNNENLYRNIGMNADPSAGDNSYASSIKGSRYAVAVNMQAIYDLPYIKLLSEIGGKRANNYISIIESVDNIYFRGDDDITLTIQMTNTKDNALKQLVGFARQIGGI